MPTVDTDVLVHVYNIPQETQVGQISDFTTTVHPGSNKLISGWQWDKRVWPTVNELEATSFVPTIWDPTLSGLSTSVFQSGYGDNNDLVLLDIEEIQLSGLSSWSPKIHHGYFYIHDEQWYLYGDQYLSESLSLNNVVSGMQYHDMSHNPKPTIPIQLRRYLFNVKNSKYQVDLDIRKKVEFDGSDDTAQFVVDNDYSPPRIWTSGIYNEAVGGTVSGVSGDANTEDIESLELVGFSNGEEDQEFFTRYSPIDRTQPVEVWTWWTASGATEWTTISGMQEFTSGDSTEVHIDYDRGALTFGDYNFVTSGGDAGRIPLINQSIGIYYTKGLALQYEPTGSVDYYTATSTNVNPVVSSLSQGFIQVSSSLPDPATVELTSSLTRVNPFIISLGNNTGQMQATVKNASGEGIDGQEVVFEILSPAIGTFGGVSQNITGTTGVGGTATVLYNAPTTINDLGVIINTGDITTISGQTSMVIDGLADPGSVSGLYLYKVHTYDEVLGIAESELSTYYTNYFLDESISGVIQSDEESYRSIHDFQTPQTYESDDYSTGKKTIILTQTAGVMNPHTGVEDLTAYTPLFPISIESTGTTSSPQVTAVYDTELPIPGAVGDDIRSYFCVGDAVTSLRAYVIHPRTGRYIYSNTIQVKVTIPDAINGTFFADSLTDLSGMLNRPAAVSGISDSSVDATSGVDGMWEDYLEERLSGTEVYRDWFRRTRLGDTVGLTALEEELDDATLSGLISVTPQTPTTDITVPFGFRLRSTGLTVASMLDQVTYLDPNDTFASGTFDVDYQLP
jgi:hypothetical protein